MILWAASKTRDTALLAGDKGYVRYMRQYALRGEGANIAVYTASIRIQDIVDIQNRLQDIGSTQDIVPIYQGHTR